MRTNYVLIDYQNVQPEALALLSAEHFKVLAFLGANQTKVPIGTAEALQRMGERAEYIRISGNGPNALDFHIAYYIGQIASREPDAYFHIISRDTGFDPLIEHAKSKRVFVSRWDDVNQIPIVKATIAVSLQDRLALIVAHLRQRGDSKPKRVNTLMGTIQSFFSKQLSEQELIELLGELKKRKLVVIKDTKVAYASLDDKV